MSDIKVKLHELIDGTNDDAVLENLYGYLKSHTEQRRKDILDELSEEDRLLLHDSMAEYRRGEFRSHEEILKLLREWRGK